MAYHKLMNRASLIGSSAPPPKRTRRRPAHRERVRVLTAERYAQLSAWPNRQLARTIVRHLTTAAVRRQEKHLA